MLIGGPVLKRLSRQPRLARALYPFASEEKLSEVLSRGAKETLSWSEGVGSSLGAGVIWIIIFVVNSFIEIIIPWTFVLVMFLMLFVPNIAIIVIAKTRRSRHSKPLEKDIEG